MPELLCSWGWGCSRDLPGLGAGGGEVWEQENTWESLPGLGV